MSVADPGPCPRSHCIVRLVTQGLPLASSSFAASLLFLAAACSSPGHPRAPAVTLRAADVATAPSAPPPAVAPTTHVLMISGGGSPFINYQSHLRHLETLRDLLVGGGLSPDRISVLTSDGAAPDPDLATRDLDADPDFWRLSGTRLEQRLGMPTTTVNSVLPGVTLEPASRAHVTEWFEAAARRLHAGDTLVVYVTDHGTRHGDDPLDNRIMLWGKDEFISARELGALVAKLDPGVRVVSLMSQCFSGGFATLANARTTDGEPAGNVCGYFSSTADRRAYGCFPENRGKANVGHSFEFMRALARTGRFQDAHEAVLADDFTPDVPLRTSDTYLESLVAKDAAARGVTLTARADELLHAAFADAPAWERDTRLLDRIAQSAGSFSPRSLAEIDELGKRLPEIDEQLTNVSHAWREALGDANGSNLERFVAARPDWGARLAEPALAALDPAATRALSAALLPDVAAFTATDASSAQRISALKTRGDDAEAASYRMQVRLAVVLRMRTVLLSIAGRAYLRQGGTPAEQRAFDALTACEDLSLPKLPPAAEAAPATATPAYPPFEDDVKLTRSALPGWMGIRFKDPGDELRSKQHLPPGATLVALVFPDSPAKAAGLEIGDIVLGPPGAPFTARNQIRAWTMLSEVGKPGTLQILRGKARRQISIVPAPFPMKWPSLPGAVQVGADAPALELESYRGAVAQHVKKSSKHLLYFWATWCGPCKAALPELLAFEKERKIPIVAVTDEDRKALDAFFKTWKGGFPNAVGLDQLRRAFVAYGVSGTPMFVLVDEHGKVAGSQIGYGPEKGLAFDGWTWSGRPAPVSKP